MRLLEYVNMDESFRNKFSDDGKLYYQHVHTLMLCVTIDGIKQFLKGSGNNIEVNYVVRPFEVYNPYSQSKELKELVKMEIFFLSYYHLVKKQSFVYVEREDVS